MNIFVKSLALAAAVLVGGQAHAQETLRLSFHTAETDRHWLGYVKPWIEKVNADPSGAVKIVGYPNGALGANLAQQPQMVLDGVTDIAYVVQNLSAGRFPDDQLFELPGFVTDLAAGTYLHQALVEGGHLRGYDDYVVLGSMVNAPSYFFARQAIESVEDLRGMNVRMIGALGAKIAAGFGMVPVQMPPTEVIEALGRRTIEAVATNPLSLVDFGMARVTSHDFMLPINTNTFAILMSRQRFDALPQEAKDTLLRHSGKAFADLYLQHMSELDQQVIGELAADPERTVVQPSEADREAAAVVFAKVTEDWLTADPANADLYKVATGLLKQIPN